VAGVLNWDWGAAQPRLLRKRPLWQPVLVVRWPYCELLTTGYQFPYHGCVRERVLSYIRTHALMRPGERIGVAVSGGADSVALLRLLLEARAELGIVLSVVHFNHKIRAADADADEQFVRELAREFDLELHSDSGDTPGYARAHKLSLEAAARILRYGFFDRLVGSPPRPGTVVAPKVAEDAARNPGEAPGPLIVGLNRVATAHTRDDQAETVLLRFLRGAGTRGLAGIHPQLRDGAIVRPLLEIGGEDLRAYLREAGQPWREDASNRDVSFARNCVRHQLLPLLTRDYNPALAMVLSDVAEIARAEEEYWQDVVRGCLPKLLTPAGDEPSILPVEFLRARPLALQRRMLRAAAEQQGLRLEFRHVEQVRALLRSEASALPRTIELPQGWEAVRQQGELHFQRRRQKQEEKQEFDCPLLVPGEVQLAGRKLRAMLVATSGDERSERGGRRLDSRQDASATARRINAVRLDPVLAARGLRVRNWRAGDRYWPAHTGQPKKVKELLQARHIPREHKPFWPVVTSGAELVWVPGFAAPEQFRVRDTDSEALLLEEVLLGLKGGNET
jgi:tRNA(Ile)-lysidine synthase